VPALAGVVLISALIVSPWTASGAPGRPARSGRQGPGKTGQRHPVHVRRRS